MKKPRTLKDLENDPRVEYFGSVFDRAVLYDLILKPGFKFYGKSRISIGTIKSLCADMDTIREERWALDQRFDNNPRSYALQLADGEIISENYMLTACLKYMSHDDVREMLDANELSPRFEELYDEE